jgi:hypothetical protein
MIPYVFDPNQPTWQRTADIPALFPNYQNYIHVTLDTGSVSSTVTYATAIQMGLYNYPRTRTGPSHGEVGHRVPVSIPTLETLVLDLYMGPHSHYNVLSAERLLDAGYRIMFTDIGVSIQ